MKKALTILSAIAMAFTLSLALGCQSTAMVDHDLDSALTNSVNEMGADLYTEY